jgi:hypothetical protein
MYLVVIHALSTAFSGVRTSWHKLRRTGALSDPPESRAPVAEPDDREIEAILVNDP